MSASSKKKNRNAAETGQMTERQMQEQKEAKQLKVYSTIFVVVLAVMVIFAAYSGISGYIANNGIRERSNTAMTIGDEKLSSAELNFYYMDAINSFYQQVSAYGGMFELFGMNPSLPLNEQVTDEETGTTWADSFMDSAKHNAQAVYALCQEAEKAGYALSDEELASIDATIQDLENQGLSRGYSHSKDFFKVLYGNGANEKLLREYITRNTLASSYQSFYAESLTYDDAALRAGEAENAQEYNAYNYNVYSVVVHDFMEHELKEDGTESHDHSAEAQSAAEAAAEAVAKELAAGTYANADEFDAAVAALAINAEKENAASTKYEAVLYDNITSLIREWVTDGQRKAGDITCIPNSTTSTAEDGTETTTTSSYYVVLFGSATDNKIPMDDVRHILVAFQGGTTDSSGLTTYTDAEKAAAKEAAEALLKTWQEGEATEESFMALATAESDDAGSAKDGGLIANITKDSNLVPAFLNWSIDEARKVGDTGIVESYYGYHVMYYSGNSELNYRDYMIQNDLRSADVNAWLTQIQEAMPATIVDLSLTPMDLVLQAPSAA